MTTQILCLKSGNNVGEDAVIEKIKALTEKFKIESTGTVEAKNLRELITDLVPAMEKNEVIFMLVRKDEYLRTKNTLMQAMGIRIIAHPAVLRAISLNTEEIFPDEKIEEHTAMPKGCTVFLSKNGYYSGFAYAEGKQHIIMLPLDAEISCDIADTVLNEYFMRMVNDGKVTKVIGMFGVSKTEVETAIKDIIFTNDPCTYEIKDFGGELQVALTVSGCDDDEIKRVSDEKINDITQKFSKNIYGINQPRLAELTVHSLKASGFDVSVVINPGAKTLISKLAIVPEYAAFFKFVEAGVERGGQQANDYAARLANTARINSGSDFGAAITNVFTTTASGEKISVMYIALADGRNVRVRKVYSKNPDNAGEILNSAATCLLELIYRKSEEYLQAMLTSSPIVDYTNEIPADEITAAPNEESAVQSEGRIEAEGQVSAGVQGGNDAGQAPEVQAAERQGADYANQPADGPYHAPQPMGQDIIDGYMNRPDGNQYYEPQGQDMGYMNQPSGNQYYAPQEQNMDYMNQQPSVNQYYEPQEQNMGYMDQQPSGNQYYEPQRQNMGYMDQQPSGNQYYEPQGQNMDYMNRPSGNQYYAPQEQNMGYMNQPAGDRYYTPQHEQSAAGYGGRNDFYGGRPQPNGMESRANGREDQEVVNIDDAPVKHGNMGESEVSRYLSEDPYQNEYPFEVEKTEIDSYIQNYDEHLKRYENSGPRANGGEAGQVGRNERRTGEYYRPQRNTRRRRRPLRGEGLYGYRGEIPNQNRQRSYYDEQYMHDDDDDDVFDQDISFRGRYYK